MCHSCSGDADNLAKGWFLLLRVDFRGDVRRGKQPGGQFVWSCTDGRMLLRVFVRADGVGGLLADS